MIHGLDAILCRRAAPFRTKNPGGKQKKSESEKPALSGITGQERRIPSRFGASVAGGGGDFRVQEWVGEGSYARVYRAEGAHGSVALKLAKVEVHGAEDRLLREEEAHARCVHAAIPVLFDAGRTEPAAGSEPGAPWLARRWVEGSTLRQRLERDHSLPLIRSLPALLRLADAVATLHAAGWTHGDLRPDNILLESGTHLAFLLDLVLTELLSLIACRLLTVGGRGNPLAVLSPTAELHFAQDHALVH